MHNYSVSFIAEIKRGGGGGGAFPALGSNLYGWLHV